MIEPAGAAGRDDRNRDSRRNCCGQLAVEAGFRAIAIDRGEQDFAGAAILRFARPLDRVPSGAVLTAAGEHRESPAVPLRIDRDDDCLTPVAGGERGDQRRCRQRRGVQAHFVGARVDCRCGVGFRADAATDRKRDE